MHSTPLDPRTPSSDDNGGPQKQLFSVNDWLVLERTVFHQEILALTRIIKYDQEMGVVTQRNSVVGNLRTEMFPITVSFWFPYPSSPTSGVSGTYLLTLHIRVHINGSETLTAQRTVTLLFHRNLVSKNLFSV